MNPKPHHTSRLRRSGNLFGRGSMLLLILLMLLSSFGPQSGSLGWQHGAAATPVLSVIEYGTGTPILEYQWLINEDNTSSTPSLVPMPSHSPVIATGDQNTPLPDLTEADGRFLITVRNDNYKLGGAHFTGGDTQITVELVPEPLPLSTIRVHAFLDNAPVNGEDDIPREQGLGGFRVILEDTVGEVVVDWFGNPLCGTGLCMTDDNGDLVIENLPRGKYEVLVLPPAGQVDQWVQTTTIEGTKIIDAWIMEGDQGYSPREGFQQAAVWVGFVPRNYSAWDGTAAGTIMGSVKTIVEWTPPTTPLTLGPAVDRPWIAVTDLGNDQLAHIVRGNPDGSFTINNVPDGSYQLAIWDEPLDYIIAFRTVTVSGGTTVDMSEIGIPRWFGWSSGHVFLDEGSGDPVNDRNGYWDAGEAPLPSIELLMRFRDGSIRYGTFTDNNGYYEFPEVFELEKFYITEVGFSHLGFSGAAVHGEFVGDPGSAIYDPENAPIVAQYPDALTVANLNWAAKRNVVDWGKYNYAPGENGGISGIVQYATTRNEFEARLQATEDYEPGVPGVTVNLYEANPDFDPTAMPGEPNSDPRGAFIESVETDVYEHPTSCDAKDATGAPIADPLLLGPNCIEVPNISNEVKEGLFDGGYAFAGLAPGDYVVEVVLPTGYKIVTEADLNTAEGNDLVPAIPPAGCVGDLTFMDVPDEYGSPYDGEYMPLCDRKGVTLQEGQNKGVDFYLMTDNGVPIPGRVYGFLLDDLNVETDPTKIYYGEKRGVPNTPVGVYDFTGRLITTVNSDENGIWSVLLPSTYVADCPIPSGVCPNVYRFVGNDPGTPENPNPDYNPNYQTIAFQFDVWPGKTTYADIALFPITAFTEFPPGQFFTPAICSLPETTPQIFTASPPYGEDGAVIAIEGTGFEASSQVTIGGIPVPTTFNDANHLTATVTGVPAGPHQLLVENASGETSPTGITFHRLLTTGPAPLRYDPDIIQVPAEASTIQAAIDNARNNQDTLVVVSPGVYFDAVNLNRGRIKLQGYGPGDPSLGPIVGGGSVLDQRFVVGGPNGLNVTGTASTFDSGFNVQIDGFRISGARDEQDIGGGLHVDQQALFLEISNNLIQSNGGNFGGGITLGLPYREDVANGDSNNDNIRIHHNRVLNNGGISLAGGIGIFNGAENYEIDHNQICGNYSGEYGGGISHFGLSNGGSIHDNKILWNAAFDEGAGIMIAGELPVPPATITSGSGAVDIDANLIQGNLSNDDGGGIRLLQPWDYPIRITNNLVVNNVATDFGGGVSLDDASQVTLINNTIARNASTSTAEDSDGQPHSAGLISEPYSPAFSAYLGVPGGFPDPLMFNNLFWENQAYTWDGVALNFDSIIDLEVYGGGAFSGGPGNLIGVDPGFVNPYDTELDAVAFRMEPDFVSVVIVSVGIPADGGNYHLGAGSAAIDAGAASHNGVFAPDHDIDGDGRPQDLVFDVGADEVPGATPPPPPNEPPTAAFTFTCTGLSCDFDASSSNDPDGAIIDYAWDFGDGNMGSGVTVDHIYAAAGAYVVTLTATDDGAIPASDTATQEVVASNATSIHLGDLSGEAVIINPGQPNERWDAIVTVSAHDEYHLPAAGVTATVRFTWTNNTNGNQSFADSTCTTDITGMCQVTRRFNPSNTEDTVEIELLGLTHASLTYVAGANDVPTTIFVSRQ